MKSSTAEILPLLGTSMGGGFYAGRIRIEDQAYALIVAPKAEGELESTAWIARNKSVPGAMSYCDGWDNTMAIASAGSKLAKWAGDLRIGGFDDWYLPAQDELEILYRNLKPGTQENFCWARSGVNVSAINPTFPYTPTFPVQTLAEAFQAGAAEAFAQSYYWSSTQHASASDYAWYQYFGYGNQHHGNKDGKLRARAVRRLIL